MQVPGVHLGPQESQEVKGQVQREIKENPEPRVRVWTLDEESGDTKPS